MAEALKLIAGLGNPGPRYEETRHNAGFWFVEQLAKQHNAVFRGESKFHGETCQLENNCRLLKPLTYMNHSGRAVSALVNFYRIPVDQILVVHDDLDLPAGTAKLKRGGGHGGHNGLRDISAALGANEFLRLRLGVGHPGRREEVINHVLDKPSQTEHRAIEEAFEAALEVLPLIMTGQLNKAMNILHGTAKTVLSKKT